VTADAGRRQRAVGLVAPVRVPLTAMPAAARQPAGRPGGGSLLPRRG